MKNLVLTCCLTLFLSLLYSEIYSQAILKQYTNIPTMYIDTEGGIPVTSKTTYIPAVVNIVSSDTTENLSMITEIRGRGNGTWGKPKKPYRIKLSKKTNLLNMPAKAKIWTMLANQADKTLMRNALAFKIGELVELEFTPSGRFVDLVFNGEYQGNYFVADQIRVEKDRVDIEEQEPFDTELPDITGGYLLELDGYASSEPKYFVSGKGVPITVKYPNDDEISDAQMEYIEEHINKFESRLFAKNFKDSIEGYRPWIDEHSLINWYIACELTGNPDCFWSTYIYKRRNNNKIFFGPLWDYDIAFNNDHRMGNAEEKLMRNYAHYPINKQWLMQISRDEWFHKAVKERWNQLIENKLEEKLLAFIDDTRNLIYESQELNYNIWGPVHQASHLEYYLFDTYDEGVDYLSDYIKVRIAYLTESFNTNIEPYTPFEPENYYYMIKNDAADKFISVVDNSTLPDAALCIWDEEKDNYSQHWEIVSTDTDNEYQIINRASKLAIWNENLAKDILQKESDSNDINQRWKLEQIYDNNGVVGLTNIASSSALDNRGGAKNNGNLLIGWTSETTSNANQQWRFVKVEPINPEEPNIPDNVKDVKFSRVYITSNPISKSDGITIILPENVSGSIIVELFNVKGNRLFNKNYRNLQEIHLAIPSINKGIYILRITTKDILYNQKLFVLE
ncbi:hypothetical protein M2138_000026 [Dysgonomonadaceae bacterium PH5-43]|nr:hypothetical protein [Dysgonomonadaceae bacterium PH5-43]